jgi:hypothetical protein
MNVVIAQVDVPYPCLCAVYRCTCGAEEARYGDQSAVPPAGWLVEWREGGDEAVACPECLSAHRPPADAPRS